MRLNYSLSSPDFAITPAITAAVEESLSKLHNRHDIQRTDITLNKKPSGFRVSMTSKPEQGSAVHCEESNKDLYSALSSAKGTLLRQLGDQKAKSRDFHRTPAREAVLED